MNNLNEIPNGWMETTLADSVSKLGDGLHGTPKYSEEGEYYFINGNNLNDGKIEIKKETKRCSTVEYEKYKKELNSRTILVSINGSLGYFAYYNNEKCFLGKSACYFNVKDSISKNFIGYQIRRSYFQKYIRRLAGGTTIKNVSLKTMREYPFLIPKDIEEQKAIANILSAFDEKIENLQAQNKTLVQTAQTIFQEWFGTYQLGDDLPEGWRVGEFEEVIEFINGYAFKSKDLLKEEEPESFKVFKMGDIKKGGGFNHNKTKNYFPKKGSDKLEKYILKNGDLLMSMTDMKDAISLLGHTALMIYDNEYIVNQRVGLIRANNDINIDYPFLYLLTNDKHFIANLRGRANSGVQVNLSTKAIKESLFNIPDKETNKKFDDLVKPLFEKRKHNYIAIQSLKKTRDTLLPKLMSGKLRVNEFKD